MKKCFINGCNSHTLNKYVSYHSLVRKGEVRDDWRRAIETLNDQFIDSNQPLNRFVICNTHFDQKYIRTLGTKIYLREDAVPTVFPHMTEQKNKPTIVILDPALPDDLDEKNEPPVKLQDPPLANDIDKKCINKKFEVDTADQETLKRKCLHYKNLYMKKNSMLKVTKRKLALARKEAKIKHLQSLLDDIQENNNFKKRVKKPGSSSSALQPVSGPGLLQKVLPRIPIADQRNPVAHSKASSVLVNAIFPAQARSSALPPSINIATKKQPGPSRN